MNELKEKVIGFLNMGLNPTVIGFHDDGLFYLFDRLLKGKQSSSSYDPTFSFIHISLNYLDSLTISTVEAQINEALSRDIYPGNTVFETYDNNVETICVIDDLTFLKSPESAIDIADNMIKKYRGKLKFVFAIEDPMFLEKLKGSISPSSVIYDAVIYQEIGKSWSKDVLTESFESQFKVKLDQQKTDVIFELTGGHYGMTKRAYQDAILKTDSFKRYVDLLIETFDPAHLNAIKKKLKTLELSIDDEKIVQNYVNTGFIQPNNHLSIPYLENLISGSVIRNKINLNEESKLIGLDLNLLNKIERTIIETLMKSGEVLPKDQIGKAIWGDQFSAKYSDWAIDQRIARLRRKIIDLGFNIDIQTVYAKGYSIVKL